MLDISLGLLFDIYLEFIVFFFCLASGFWLLASGLYANRASSQQPMASSLF
jgi:hypothetical protein